jgi:hypothetical protein
VPGLVELEGAVPQAVPHRRARQLVFEGGHCSIKPEAIPSASGACVSVWESWCWRLFERAAVRHGHVRGSVT